MYLNFFGLHKQPFNITPDPELLFASPSHREALAALTWGISERKGTIALIGEVGVGKTMIIRCVLDRVRRTGVKIILLFNSSITFPNLLRTIFRSLGSEPACDDLHGMVRELRKTLGDLYQSGSIVVLVIDEAQNMPTATLSQLHLLSNLETGTEKLVQIVFSGQPEFEDTLNSSPLRQLKQRIAVKVRLLPLTGKESVAYIQHRLTAAGHSGPALFSAGAMRQITREAAGIPRRLNTLCDNCLITAYGNQQRYVSTAVAREVIADFGEPRRQKSSWRTPSWQVSALASLALAALAIWFSGPFPPEPPVARPAVHHPARAPREAKLPMPPQERPPVREVRVAPEAEKPVPVVTKKTKRPDRKQVRRAVRKKGSLPVFKVVRRGDTLPKLVRETYGSLDQYLIELVRHNNPLVKTIDNLQGGERIYFPSRHY